MKLTGAEILIECLKREGVKTIFALPGGVVLKIFDMLHQQKDIEVILTRHEQGAGHMAEGYAKATGKAGGKRYDPITTCFHSSIVGQVWEPRSLTVCLPT